MRKFISETFDKFDSKLIQIPNDRKRLAIMWATFVVVPFFTFIISLWNIRKKQYRIFLLLFFALYGYLFIPMPDADATRYFESFNLYSSYSLHDLTIILSRTYTTDSTSQDFYAPLLLFLTTRITYNYRIFFLIVSIIYFSVAFKLWETIWESINGDDINFYSIFFLGAIFLLNFSSGINNIRWPLGFMVFSLGSLKYILTTKKKFLILACLSFFIHYSMIYPLLFLLLFSLLQFSRNSNLIIILLIVILITTSVLSQFISSKVGLFGSAIQNEFLGFSSEGYVETRTTHISNWPWYVRINMYASRYFLMLSLILVYAKKSTIIFDDKAKKLFMFVTLLLIQCILSGNILDPMTNNRYYFVFILFGLITLNYVGKVNQSYILLRRLSYVYIPILLLRALIIIRTDLYTINPLLIFGNIFTIFFPKTDINIYDLLFG